MDILATFFDRTCKCNSCFKPFELIQKRRKCRLCSKNYLEKIFCKYCSTKIAKIFGSKRYCNKCYHKMNIEKNASFETIRSQSLKKYKIGNDFDEQSAQNNIKRFSSNESKKSSNKKSFFS